MSYEYSEDNLIENATQEALENLGWTVKRAWHKEQFSKKLDRSDGLLGRKNKSEVLLVRDCLATLRNLNPNLPETAYQYAMEKLGLKVVVDILLYLKDYSSRCNTLRVRGFLLQEVHVRTQI